VSVYLCSMPLLFGLFFSVTGSGGLEAITNRRGFESIEVSVFMTRCLPVYFFLPELLISVFFHYHGQDSNDRISM
jgi:hypothetical protein